MLISMKFINRFLLISKEFCSMKSKSTASQMNTQANIFIHSIQICLIPMLEQINIKAKAIIPTIEKDIAIILFCFKERITSFNCN